MTEPVTLRSLHRGLRGREAPEEVFLKILELVDVDAADLRHFPRRRSSYPTSMRAAWQRPRGMAKQLEVLQALTGREAPSGLDVEAVRAYLADVRFDLGMETGHSSFKNHRKNRLARRRSLRGPALAEMSRRRYDKMFRLVARLTERVETLGENLEMADLTQFAKVGFGMDVRWDEFRRSPSSAAFVAYYVANLGRRSLFTVGKQARALDKGAEVLLRACEADPNASWLAVAQVFPRWDVLARCSLDDRVELLERAFLKMRSIAERLRGATTETMDLDKMVVRRGDDSSTWNALAGAWNKARELWIAAAWSVDPSVAEAFLPGKVLRLMAADVAAWHRRAGGGLDPDTMVWRDLPRPWEVLSGEKSCTRERVVAACVLAGVDPDKSGWAKPRPRTDVDLVRETPELVHGVVVGHPQLAEILRRAGWFSGYEARARESAPAVEEAGREARADHAAAQASRA